MLSEPPELLRLALFPGFGRCRSFLMRDAFLARFARHLFESIAKSQVALARAFLLALSFARFDEMF